MAAGLAAIGVILLGAILGYLISLHIAAIGAQADALDTTLKARRDDVRKLHLEIDTRSRFAELQRWSPVLGLRPAGIGQYAQSEKQLYSMAAARRTEIADHGANQAATPCGGGSSVVPANCHQHNASPEADYTPQARKKLDTLIDGILK